MLVALDDLVVGDLGKGLALPHTFDVADRFTGRGMDHAKGNPALARGRMQLDRDQHEGQAQRDAGMTRNSTLLGESESGAHFRRHKMNKRRLALASAGAVAEAKQSIDRILASP